MGKISAEAFSMAGDKYLGRKYSEMDCQKFCEKAMADAGLHMDLGGSNSWYREMTWTGTPEECLKVFGSIPKGALLFILEPVSDSTPAKYRKDGIGDVTHMGIVTRRSGAEMVAHGQQEGAQGAESCNFGDGAIHSSSSRKHVCTSKFADRTISGGGWNRIGLYRWFTYGAAIDAILAGKPSGGGSGSGDSGSGGSGGSGSGGSGGSGSGGSGSGGSGSGGSGEGDQPAREIVTGVIVTSDGGPANMRNTPSMKERLWWKIPAGNTIEIEQAGIVKNGYEWVHGSAMDEKYRLVTGYVRSEYVKIDQKAETADLPWNNGAANVSGASGTAALETALQAGNVSGASGTAAPESITLTLTLPRDMAEIALDVFERLAWQLTQIVGRG